MSESPNVLPRPEWLASPIHDWPEDFGHENGQYHCVCISCRCAFIGHKRRATCYVCAQEQARHWEAMSEADREAEKERLHQAIEQIFADDA